MKALAELVFIGEIVQQSKIANRAAERLRSIDSLDGVEVWCSIQSILTAAGIVSNILWPSRKYVARGNALRALLTVDEQNLLSDRKFRNYFEHYDTRIEQWFEKNNSAVYIDSIIGSFKPLRVNNPDWNENPPNLHRAYNPQTQVLTFRGESFDLGALLNALDEIRLKCRPLVLP